MREISITELYPQKPEKQIDFSGLESALIKAISKINPPPVKVEPVINLTKEKCKYLITVNRDDYGRVQSMVVEQYESY